MPHRWGQGCAPYTPQPKRQGQQETTGGDSP